MKCGPKPCVCVHIYMCRYTHNYLYYNFTNTNLNPSVRPSTQMNPKKDQNEPNIVISLTVKTNNFDSLNYVLTHNYQNVLNSLYSNYSLCCIILRHNIYQSHIISSLLCLAGIILSTFIFDAQIILNSHYLLSFATPITMIAFAVCEAAIILALLVMISNIQGISYVQNLNLL